MAITFVGEEAQLILALAQSDLNLTLLPGIGWELRLAGSAMPSAAALGASPEPEPAAESVGRAAVPTADAPIADAPMADSMNAPNNPTAE